MGYDIYGQKPTAPEGEYFRMNIWYWPPLVQLCRELAPQESRGCKGWDENAGYGLNSADATRLGNRLAALLEDGTVATYLAAPREQRFTDLQIKGLQFMKHLRAVQPATSFRYPATMHRAALLSPRTMSESS